MPTPSYPTTYTDKASRTRPLPSPSLPVTYGIKTNILTTTFESGHEQRRKKGEPLKTFEFNYEAIDYYQLKAIQTFFLARSGSVEAFFWTDKSVPGVKPTYLVKFDMEAFSPERIAHHYSRGPIFKLTVKLKQVF